MPAGFTSVRTDEDFESLLDDLRVTVRPVLKRGDVMRRCVQIVADSPALIKLLQEAKTDGQIPKAARKRKAA